MVTFAAVPADSSVGGDRRMAVAAAKPGVGRDHALNLVEGDFSDWLRRRDQEEFGLVDYGIKVKRQK